MKQIKSVVISLLQRSPQSRNLLLFVKPNFDKVFFVYYFHAMVHFLPQGVPESQKQCRLTYKLVGTGINYYCPKV